MYIYIRKLRIRLLRFLCSCTGHYLLACLLQLLAPAACSNCLLVFLLDRSLGTPMFQGIPSYSPQEETTARPIPLIYEARIIQIK